MYIDLPRKDVLLFAILDALKNPTAVFQAHMNGGEFSKFALQDRFNKTLLLRSLLDPTQSLRAA